MLKDCTRCIFLVLFIMKQLVLFALFVASVFCGSYPYPLTLGNVYRTPWYQCYSIECTFEGTVNPSNVSYVSYTIEFAAVDDVQVFTFNSTMNSEIIAKNTPFIGATTFSYSYSMETSGTHTLLIDTGNDCGNNAAVYLQFTQIHGSCGISIPPVSTYQNVYTFHGKPQEVENSEGKEEKFSKKKKKGNKKTKDSH